MLFIVDANGRYFNLQYAVSISVTTDSTYGGIRHGDERYVVCATRSDGGTTILFDGNKRACLAYRTKLMAQLPQITIQ